MAGTRMILPTWQFFKASGAPLVGGKLYTYEAGTTTPLATYSDSALSVANTNPIVLDGNAYAGTIYTDPDLSYKFVLKDSDDVTIWTQDAMLSGGQTATGNVEDDSVTGPKLAAAVAGDGLVQDGSGNLDVNVDDSSIEIDTDVVQVKAAGITAAMLVTGNAQVSISPDDTTPGRLDGKLLAGDNITLIVGSPGGDETLTIDTKYRGALIGLANAGDTILDGTPDEVDWDVALHDTDSFDDIGGSNPERLTVTASDIAYVRLSLQLRCSVSSASSDNLLRVQIRKNGGDVAGGVDKLEADYNYSSASNSVVINGITGVIAVAQNDYFDVYVTWTDDTGNTSMTLNGDNDGNIGWFGIEVLE